MEHRRGEATQGQPTGREGQPTSTILDHEYHWDMTISLSWLTGFPVTTASGRTVIDALKLGTLMAWKSDWIPLDWMESGLVNAIHREYALTPRLTPALSLST